MKQIPAALILLLLFVINQSGFGQDAKNLADYVNPLLGTDSDVALSNGNTYPAIALPWGMNFWTPTTNSDRRSGWAYTYDAYKIYGFKQTHQPSPWVNDYGVFSILPMTGELKMEDKERGSWYSHKTEISKPYYYRAYLADYDLVTEITPTERAAQFRITYPESDKSYLIVDGYGGGNYIKIIPGEQKIIGYTKYATGSVPENFKTHFVLYFDKEFDVSYTWKDGELDKNAQENDGGRVQAIIRFKTKTNEQVNIKVASSFISLKQAELNLKREIGEDSFDETKSKAMASWNKELNRIEVEGGTVDQLRTFYTALYRVLLFPRKFFEYDENNKIVHYSPYNGKVLPGYMFTDNGFWDTFRAVFPFFTIMYRELDGQIMAGLVNTYKEGGWLPEWASPGYHNVMIGSNSASIIADAYLSGIRGYDIETLFEAILKNSENEGPITSVGRYGVDYYNSLGYIPYDVGVHESVARTLEYSYDDFTIWKLAQALNKEQEVIDLFAKRAKFYQNVFDPSTNFMRGRNKDGSWQSPFVPEKWGDAFTEGCSWHYTWAVFHDPKGLMNLMGGREAFIEKLDSLFTAPPKFDDSYYGGQIHEITEMLIANMGQYAHGNQPIQHGIYLYDYAGEPWKAQKLVRTVMDKLYTPAPDGLCGDEDNGQTSAWYVLSAMGIYSVCPGSGEYAIGSPLFDKVTLHLENGNSFEFVAENNTPESVYIDSAELNGYSYSKNYLLHDDIMNGGTLLFSMSDTPNKRRGINPEDAPYSMSNVDFSAPPYLKSGDVNFLENTSAELACRVESAEIRFTLDGSEPDMYSKLYTGSIPISESIELKAKAFDGSKEASPIMQVKFEKDIPQQSLQVNEVESGLKYEYFEGRYRSVDQLENPLKSGSVSSLDLSIRDKDDHFGIIFSGYIEVPETGGYTFYLSSDDGSKLFLNDELVVNHDGHHGGRTAVQKSTYLFKGMHKLTVKYFEGVVDQNIKLEWQGPGIDKQPVPQSAFFRDKSDLIN